MFELVAKIDSYDQRFYNEFKNIIETGSPGDVKSWLLENCEIPHEKVNHVFDDVIMQDSEFMITFCDIMCETVSLYYF